MRVCSAKIKRLRPVWRHLSGTRGVIALGRIRAEQHRSHQISRISRRYHQGGDWIHFTSRDYSLLPSGQWEQNPGNRRAAISRCGARGFSPLRGTVWSGSGSMSFSPSSMGPTARTAPCRGFAVGRHPLWGSHVAASAVAMDKNSDQVGGRSGRRPAGRLALGVGR